MSAKGHGYLGLDTVESKFREFWGDLNRNAKIEEKKIDV